MIKKEPFMIILNINGPVNAGKSTVSKVLEKKIENSFFIEVDDLMTDEEEESLNLSIQEGWKERCNRLVQKLNALKKSKTYETVIFAYPITEKTYQEWKQLEDKTCKFLNITLAPSLEVCLTNRGERKLNEWEINRIQQMYQKGYHSRDFADLIINNDHLTPEETADVIMSFLSGVWQNKK